MHTTLKLLKENKQLGLISIICLGLFGLAVFLALTTGESGMPQQAASNPSPTTAPNQSSPAAQRVIVSVEAGSMSDTDTNSGTNNYSFRKGDIGVENDMLHIASIMTQSGSGICAYFFSQDGTTKVQQRNEITDSDTCEINIPTSKFVAGESYDYTVEFLGNDGTSSAHQISTEITFN